MDNNTNTSNTIHSLYLAVQDIAEMVNAYFQTVDAPAPGKFQLIGVAGFTVGNTEIRISVNANTNQPGLWMTTFKNGLFVDRTCFASLTDNISPATIEAIATQVRMHIIATQEGK